MNCQEINLLLDSNDADLTDAQSGAVQQHLASCRDCGAEWAAWNEIATPVPSPHPGFHARIAAALAAQSPAPVRLPQRTFLISGLLVAGAALAATAAWQMSNREQPASMNAQGVSATVVVPSETQVAGAAAAGAILPPETGTQPGSADAQAATAAADAGLDPHTIVVLRRPEQVADGQAMALADRCFEAVVAELRGLGGLNVATDSSLFRMTSFSEELTLTERDQKIARSHHAGNALVVTTQMGCNFALFNTETRARVDGAGGGGVDPQAGREDALARGMARGIHAHILVDGNAEADESRMSLLNASLGDRDRATALARLVQGRGNGPRSREAARSIFDKEVLAVAIQLATKSPDPEVRSTVWAMLRQADDAVLVPPLLQAIANDADKSTRFQAIQAVRKFLDVPGVREALQRAAKQDPDSQLEHFCCVVTVREAAERAAVPDSEFLPWVRSRLLDESLPARSRLINLMGFSNDGRFVLNLARIGGDSAAVVFEIAQSHQDSQERAMAWDVLYSGQAERGFMVKEVVPVLLSDLRISTDERVRAGAARIIANYGEIAGVKEAIERAQSDESIMVRRAASGAGMAPVSAD